MKKRTCLPILLGFLLAWMSPVLAARAEEVPLDQLSHIHGLAVAPHRPDRLLLATHVGLFLARPEGFAKPVAGPTGDLMAFAVDPRAPERIFVSGHPTGGGNIGVLLSTDGGRRWRRISAGAGGHVGFHLIAVSGADPDVLYGITNGLHVSRDGGRTWNPVGNIPERLIDFAASAVNVGTLYAGTMTGLLVSRDGGAKWTPAYPVKRPTSMVHVSRAGRVYAFVVGVGLIAAEEPGLDWERLADDFQDRFLLRLAGHPTDPARLYAVTATSAIMTSPDGGKSWIGYEGSQNATPEKIARGRKLYESTCQFCHGANGVGEDPSRLGPDAADVILAPPLNDSAHAWHHSDHNLVETILNGSPRPGSRMFAWKNILSRDDAESVVAYVKSLWSFRSLACQGARHMTCMGPMNR